MAASKMAAAWGVSARNSNRSTPDSIWRPGVPVRMVSRMWAKGRTPPTASVNVAQERIPAVAPLRRRSPTTREAEVSGLVLLEHAQGSQDPEHSVQGRLVRARSSGQLLGASRALGEEVGDAQLGDGVDAAGDVDAPDHGQQSAGGGPLGGGGAGLGRCSWRSPFPPVAGLRRRSSRGDRDRAVFLRAYRPPTGRVPCWAPR